MLVLLLALFLTWVVPVLVLAVAAGLLVGCEDEASEGLGLDVVESAATADADDVVGAGSALGRFCNWLAAGEELLVGVFFLLAVVSDKAAWLALSPGCIKKNPKLKTTIKTSGAPIINLRLSSLCLACSI